MSAPDEAHADLQHRLHGHIDMLAGVIGERNVARYGALEASARYIEDTLKSFGYIPTPQEFAAVGKPVRNIEAELPGRKRPSRIWIIGAHYDSIDGSPAADDNASAVAGVLEVARLLAGNPCRDTVRFVAFVNEEPPFFQSDKMGSVVYAKRCNERGEKIVAMLTPETIGYYSDEPGSQKYPSVLGWFYPKVANFIVFVGESDSGALVSKCVGLFRQYAQFPSEGGAAPKSIEGVGWSDHWSFSRMGYRALMITDTAPFRYPHYHTARDTPEKCDYDRMARVVEGVARVIEHLANEEPHK